MLATNSFIKHITLLAIVSIISVGHLFAQQKWVALSGSFAKKGNYEVMIGGKEGEKGFRLAQYYIDPSVTDFSLKIPFKEGVKYNLQVAVMKEGHRRLEVDQRYSFPLDLQNGQNFDLKLNPALFGQDHKGLSIKKSAEKKNIVTVMGTVVGLRSGFELAFDQVVDGRLQTIQISSGQKGDSTFCFYVPINKEGFYSISTIRSKKRIYLKPNEDLNLVLDFKDGVEVQASKTTVENKMIAAWEKLKLPLIQISTQPKPDRAEFLTLYQSKQQAVKDFVQAIQTGNPKFDAVFKKAVLMDYNLLALNTLLKTSYRHAGGYTYQAKEFMDVSKETIALVAKDRVESSDILAFGEAQDYITLLAKFNQLDVPVETRNKWSDEEKLAFMMNSVSNDALKSLLIKTQLDELEFNVSNFSEFRDVFMPYERYVQAGAARKKYDGILNMFAADTVFIGKSSYDFTLPDVNGKMVNMKDFKGKVIFIDTWATWCGPCKAQMPFMNEIEAYYHNNPNVVFVGISTDAEKDKEKWLKMIKEKELGGVQLLDSKGKDFAKKYKIFAIPRFLLIDKDGNWSEVRCPLPETKDKLIRYIDKELKKIK